MTFRGSRNRVKVVGEYLYRVNVKSDCRACEGGEIMKWCWYCKYNTKDNKKCKGCDGRNNYELWLVEDVGGEKSE